MKSGLPGVGPKRRAHLGSVGACLALAALTTICTLSEASARPVVPAERRAEPLTGDMAACDDPFVLSQIAGRFAETERDYWGSGLEIVLYRDVRQTGLRSNGLDYVPQRYCTAVAAFNDRRERRVVYQVGKDLWFAGYGSLAEWCIVGLDRNHAYDDSCRAARP